ncbi:MAG: diaminopimelate decarboxylase [Planctomycetes bacterium]|nr:diaminopimelate decarboxylase [Planctomycetota bacterium]
MDQFTYRDGRLYCEGVPVSRIAEAVGTPVFIYSAATLRDHYAKIAEAFAELRPIICYSIKSCGNLHVIRLLAERGAGMDVVSGGELYRAVRAGFRQGGEYRPGKIVFAGVGKTDAEINEALDAGIGWFNIESEAELANLIAIAQRRGVTTRAALRVNPDVDPKTHRHTTTGKRETKFGVDLERARNVFNEFGRQPHVRLTGIHLHIGSPVNAIDAYTEAIARTLELIGDLRRDGFTIDTLDVGGGFRADYEGPGSPTARDYAARIVPLLRGQGLQVILEPGRTISANAGILLTRTVHVKQSGDKQFAIVDGSMTELIRPVLYDAYHFVWPAEPGPGFVPDTRWRGINFPGTRIVDVVGPVCETGDFLARERPLPPIRRGDLIAVFTAGAYGFVMASHYNARPNAAEVLVDGDDFRVIRRRETYADLTAEEE